MDIKTLGLAAIFWIVTIFNVQAGPILIDDLGMCSWSNEPPCVWESDDSGIWRCGFIVDSEAIGSLSQTRLAPAPLSYRGDAIMANSRRAPMLPPQAAPALQPAITEVPLLRNRYGTFTLLATLNGTTTLPFTLDTGASRVTLPKSVALELMRNGSLTVSDYVGHAISTLADGSRRRDILYRLRSVTIGGLTVPDVECSIGDERSSLLLGESFLSKFKSWSIDNSRSVLVLTAVQTPR